MPVAGVDLFYVFGFCTVAVLKEFAVAPHIKEIRPDERFRLGQEVESLTSRCHELESEILELEEKLTSQQEILEAIDSDGSGENVYVFGENDKIASAFDKFFETTDPEVERIRSDLLDDSSSKRRFAGLSAKLGG